MYPMHDSVLPGVDLNLLVLLRALLSERHVTRAARRVGLSQSAASHALARLRELYSDPLLVRRGRALEPTPRALLLVPELEQGLSQLEGTLRGQLAFDPRQARRRFTIAAADYFQATLGPLLQRLSVDAPGFELTFVSFTSSLELLESGHADLAMLARLPLSSDFSSRRLFSEGFVCMARKHHPSRFGKRLTLEQYLSAGHLLVAPGGTPGSLVDSELSRRGHQRRIAASLSSFLAAPSVVSQSELLSTGPELLWRQLAKLYPVKISLLPFRLPRFDIDLVWHGRRDADPAHTFLRETISRAAATIWKSGSAQPLRSRRELPR
jgi:DNA-binding transcriptional LysR family regulator